MNFPADRIKKIEPLLLIEEALNIRPDETWKGKDDYMVILPSQKHVEDLNPDFRLICKLGSRGIICTAKGDSVDFVSRCFFPQYGIDEDPVTGSAHTTLAPYWAEKLNRKKLIAKQISKRGGDIMCELLNDRVEISGQARLYLSGEINVE